MLTWLYENLSNCLGDERGATVLEYGIIILLIGAVVVATIIIVSTKIQQALQALL